MCEPYTYCIIHRPSKSIYYGVRYAVGCHPKDLWVSYFTSSTKIWDLIKQDGKGAFDFEVRKIFADAEEAKRWEHRVNRRILNWPQVLNEHAWPAVSREGMNKSKVSKAKVGSDGLTASQRGGLNWKRKKLEIDPETGLTYLELRKRRLNATIDTNGTRMVRSAASKKWHQENENPTKRPEVAAKISATLKAGIAAGSIKTTKGMKIPAISIALQGNQAVKGMKWYNNGERDFRYSPCDLRAEGLAKGRLKVKEAGWTYSVMMCPHCGKEGGGGNMKRYHFDKCKSK